MATCISALRVIGPCHWISNARPGVKSASEVEQLSKTRCTGQSLDLQYQIFDLNTLPMHSKFRWPRTKIQGLRDEPSNILCCCHAYGCIRFVVVVVSRSLCYHTSAIHDVVPFAAESRGHSDLRLSQTSRLKSFVQDPANECS